MKPPKRQPAAPSPAPEKIGHRPPYVATDKDRLTVKVMVAGGIKHTDIAGVLGISHVTLRKYYRREIATGAAEVAAQVVASLITMAVGQKPAPGRVGVTPNVHAAKWYTQARMGWSERITVVDGGAEADVKTMSDTEVADRLAKVSRSPAVLRATKAATVH